MTESSAMNAVPYIKQAGDRSCGAACLSMVYESFGSSVAQEEIWTKIAKRNSHGSVASTSHLMAKDAIERGFEAVAIQASKPLMALRQCFNGGIRVILNHRMSAASPAGHYSVLSSFQGPNVFLH